MINATQTKEDEGMSEDKKRKMLIAAVEDAAKAERDADKAWRDANRARNDAYKVCSDAERARLAANRAWLNAHGARRVADAALYDYDNSKDL